MRDGQSFVLATTLAMALWLVGGLSTESAIKDNENCQVTTDDPNVSMEEQFEKCLSGILLRSAIDDYQSGNTDEAEAAFAVLADNAETTADKTEINSAWGLAALDSGSYDLAVEKLTYALSMIDETAPETFDQQQDILDGLLTIAKAGLNGADIRRLGNRIDQLAARQIQREAWQATLNLAQTTFQAEDYVLAKTQFLAAVEQSSNGQETVISRFYLAYTMAKAGNLELADQSLLETRQIADDENLTDRSLLQSLYELSRQIAKALGNSQQAAVFGGKVATYRAIRAGVWKVDHQNNTFTHLFTGVTFPAKFAELVRSEPVQYQDDGTDVSFSYTTASGEEYFEVTVYVSNINIFVGEDGGQMTPQAYFDDAMAAIEQKFEIIGKGEEGFPIIPDRPDLSVRYVLLRAKLERNANYLMTGLLVEQISDYFLKFRVTYEAEMGFEGRELFESFIAGFDWPQPQDQGQEAAGQ